MVAARAAAVVVAARVPVLAVAPEVVPAAREPVQVPAALAVQVRLVQAPLALVRPELVLQRWAESRLVWLQRLRP